MLASTGEWLDDIKQAEFSVYAPLNQNVALTSRWHYDLEGHRTLEAFAGIEYDDCCVRFRLLARQFGKSELQESWLASRHTAV